jgi:hypothetical protein
MKERSPKSMTQTGPSSLRNSETLATFTSNPVFDKGSEVAHTANPAATGVEISIYAIPLFKNVKGDVHYVYIPVRHAEKPDAESCSSSSCAPADSILQTESSTSNHRNQQVKYQTLASSLQQQVAHATSAAQSTWDSWGRMKKGTWLRWFHDIGQTVTEDVSPEARLARGISSRATKVSK